MFGRGHGTEVLARPQRSLEEEAQMVETAYGRIEEIDGVDYLDGYELPPDNDEIWNPKTFNVSVYHTYESPRGEIFVTKEDHRFESDLVNRKIRQANIEFIATEGHPLFGTAEQRDKMVHALYADHETYGDKARKAARKLIEKVTG